MSEVAYNNPDAREQVDAKRHEQAEMLGASERATQQTPAQ
jgi:hypothetical protein